METPTTAVFVISSDPKSNPVKVKHELPLLGLLRRMWLRTGASTVRTPKPVPTSPAMVTTVAVAARDVLSGAHPTEVPEVQNVVWQRFRVAAAVEVRST